MYILHLNKSNYLHAWSKNLILILILIILFSPFAFCLILSFVLPFFGILLWRTVVKDDQTTQIKIKCYDRVLLWWSTSPLSHSSSCSSCFPLGVITEASENRFGFFSLTFGISTWECATKPETRSTLWGLVLLVTRTRDTLSSSWFSWSCSTWVFSFSVQYKFILEVLLQWPIHRDR